MPRSRSAVWLAGVIAPAAAVAQSASPPPTLDCTLGFEGLQAQARALQGAQLSPFGGFDMATQEVPNTWRVEIFFTTRWHPAYPAVAIRTLRKQVTGVWTADSKACGYGDQGQFASLVEDMKSSDKAMTEAAPRSSARSRASRRWHPRPDE